MFNCPHLGNSNVFEFQLEHCNCTRKIVLAEEAEFDEQNSGIENEISKKGIKLYFISVKNLGLMRTDILPRKMTGNEMAEETRPEAKIKKSFFFK